MTVDQEFNRLCEGVAVNLEAREASEAAIEELMLSPEVVELLDALRELHRLLETL
jgi:hypothetical protein